MHIVNTNAIDIYLFFYSIQFKNSELKMNKEPKAYILNLEGCLLALKKIIKKLGCNKMLFLIFLVIR